MAEKNDGRVINGMYIAPEEDLCGIAAPISAGILTSLQRTQEQQLVLLNKTANELLEIYTELFGELPNTDSKTDVDKAERVNIANIIECNSTEISRMINKLNSISVQLKVRLL